VLPVRKQRTDAQCFREFWKKRAGEAAYAAAGQSEVEVSIYQRYNTIFCIVVNGNYKYCIYSGIDAAGDKAHIAGFF
jgi:hypothetical protein